MANTVSAGIKVAAKAALSQPKAGTSPLKAGGGFTAEQTVSSGLADNALGGGDLVYGPVLRTLAPSTTETLTLSGSGLSDLLNDPNLNFARVKGLAVWLLSAAQTAPDGTAGTACTSIKLGGDFLAGTGRPISAAATLEVLGGCCHALQFGTAGGVTVTASSTDQLTVQNPDASHAANYLIMIEGADS